jgi:antirestriction protein ArdC
VEINSDAPEGSEDSERKIPFARASWVFNAAQVERASMPPEVIPETGPLFERLQQAEQVIVATGADISHGGARAFYQRREDRIQMPDIALFTGTETSTPQEAYYSTMLHELAHWTGAEHRLNREKGKRFADKAYESPRVF